MSKSLKVGTYQKVASIEGELFENKNKGNCPVKRCGTYDSKCDLPYAGSNIEMNFPKNEIWSRSVNEFTGDYCISCTNGFQTVKNHLIVTLIKEPLSDGIPENIYLISNLTVKFEVEKSVVEIENSEKDDKDI